MNLRAHASRKLIFSDRLLTDRSTMPEEKKEEKGVPEGAKKALKGIAAAAATFAILEAIAEREDIAEILKREDLSAAEKAKVIAKELLPEKSPSDILELVAAALAGVFVASREKAKREGKDPKEALKEIAEEIKKVKEG